MRTALPPPSRIYPVGAHNQRLCSTLDLQASWEVSHKFLTGSNSIFIKLTFLRIILVGGFCSCIFFIGELEVTRIYGPSHIFGKKGGPCVCNQTNKTLSALGTKKPPMCTCGFPEKKKDFIFKTIPFRSIKRHWKIRCTCTDIEIWSCGIC